jgi:hypothetical protein
MVERIMGKQVYHVTHTFLAAIIHEDYEGLDPFDADLVEMFLEEIKEEFTGFWSYESDEPYTFQTCDITHLGAECVRLEFIETE